MKSLLRPYDAFMGMLFKEHSPWRCLTTSESRQVNVNSLSKCLPWRFFVFHSSSWWLLSKAVDHAFSKGISSVWVLSQSHILAVSWIESHNLAVSWIESHNLAVSWIESHNLAVYCSELHNLVVFCSESQNLAVSWIVTHVIWLCPAHISHTTWLCPAHTSHNLAVSCSY